MKKVLLTLCGAVLLVALLITPALARPFWQSDLTCDFNDDLIFGEEFPARPFAVIKYPSGDLYVSTIRGLPKNTDFECVIRCNPTPTGDIFHVEDSCGTSDANGVLPAQVIQRFATRANLNEFCFQISFRIQNVDGVENCREGFVPRE
ncbi:hypothetical protein MELA_02419 [Candidatus Methylomirabilis lanthanidiphila]|uniref:Uncharacterized protein n=1 Tax=Candidatus Methylomirabilis lanthanidiphila TaxID=2211376 RepID=A0A564ZL18_9BACT|nr:hypothetical protein [Candidatus Methylomirabilis lanthanidiphila]VUZ86025.1 hypothetical protein MELA_02419 [Candidatus Methylomirabilis lanthanidiphila]